MASETQYEARAIPTDDDVEGDMPRRLAAGPMHLLVYIREDVVAEQLSRLTARVRVLVAEVEAAREWDRVQPTHGSTNGFPEAKHARYKFHDACRKTDAVFPGGLTK